MASISKTAKPARGVKTVERLVSRGRARWHGPLVELILPLAPAEVNRSLGRTARPRHSATLPAAALRTGQRWSELRRALPVIPEVQ
jgi:hypothetical protein